MYIGEFQRRNKNIPRFPTLPSIITNFFFWGRGGIVFFSNFGRNFNKTKHQEEITSSSYRSKFYNEKLGCEFLILLD